MKRLLPFLLCVSLQANDKVDHFLAGAAIGAAVNISFRWSGGSPKQSMRIGFVVGTGAGIIKEGVDQYAYKQAQRLGDSYSYSPQTDAYAKRGVGAFGTGADPWDAVATMAGACVGSWAVSKVWK